MCVILSVNVHNTPSESSTNINFSHYILWCCSKVCAQLHWLAALRTAYPSVSVLPNLTDLLPFHVKSFLPVTMVTASNDFKMREIDLLIIKKKVFICFSLSSFLLSATIQLPYFVSLLTNNRYSIFFLSQRANGQTRTRIS